MKILKSGNVTLMIFPIGLMVLIIILVAVAFVYIQIIVKIHDIKSNLFYIVSSSIHEDTLEGLACRDYLINEDNIRERINFLLMRNYINENSNNGIITIKCEEVKLVKNEGAVIKRTNGKYKEPIICVNIGVSFKPIISTIGDKVNIKIHDDIKFNLLEFEG